MKKLLLIIMAVFMSLIMANVAQAALTGFIIVDPSPVIVGEQFDIDVTTLVSALPQFTGEVNLTIDTFTDTFNITNGTGTYYDATVSSTGNFTINVSSGNISEQITATAVSYVLISSPTSVTENADENSTPTYVEETITLTNMGTESLSGINVVYSGDGFGRESFSTYATSLPNHEDNTVFVFTYDINLLTAANSPYEGDITISSNAEDVVIPVTININAPSGPWEITDFEVNGEDYDDGDTIDDGDDILPGDDLDFEIEIKNNADYDMEDVEVIVTIKDIDDGSDLEETFDIGDIDEGDKETADISFKLPFALEYDEYDVEIEVIGDNAESGSDPEDIDWDLTLKIEKENHDIAITETGFDYSSVEAGQIAYLTVELTNIGSSDEDEVVLVVKCDGLDLDFKKLNIDLDEGDDYDVTVQIEVDEDVDNKNYNIEIITYYDYDEYMDDEVTDVYQVTLSVVEAEEEEEESSYPEYSEPEVVFPEETGFEPQPIPTTTEISFSETTGYTLLLILGNILLVVLIIFLLIKLLR